MRVIEPVDEMVLKIKVRISLDWEQQIRFGRWPEYETINSKDITKIRNGMDNHNPNYKNNKDLLNIEIVLNFLPTKFSDMLTDSQQVVIKLFPQLFIMYYDDCEGYLLFSKMLDDLKLLDTDFLVDLYKQRRDHHLFRKIKYSIKDACKEVEECKIKLNKNNKKVSENELESILIANIGLIENGMKYIDRQVKVEDGRIDILAKDKNGTTCIIELKISADSNDIVEQCLYYPSQFEDEVRMIAVCPDYNPRILKSLTRLTYVEIMRYEFVEDQIVLRKIS